MSNQDRDPILLTPGPLTTSLSTRSAMLRDWGSWDSAFNEVTARLRARLTAVINGADTHVCVPMQGSGTFSVEAAVNTLVPRDGHVLVLVNGAYGKRFARLTEMMGRRLSTFETADDVPTSGADVARALDADSSISHVGLIHCETSTGILNPLPEIADAVAKRGKRLIVDAMSSFGAIPIDARATPFDALVAASGKCIEGPPGMGFVLARKSVLERCAGNSTSLALDLHDQWIYMEKTTQWRYTPPTHVVVALDAALDQFLAAGGQPARLARYTANYQVLTSGMAEMGFKAFLDPAIQAPIIVTYYAPADTRYGFKAFYDKVRDKGFVLYPGKLTQVETFRVGCIGAIGPGEMRHAVNAIRDALAELGIEQVAPIGAGRRRAEQGLAPPKAERLATRET
jgi:2-aminoethylphosphonate-pyruvate transaminase